MKYLSVSQTAGRWGITRRRIQRLCNEGRVEGAVKIGSYWAIPEDAEKPKDARIKSGKYIKKGKEQE
jgi:DNA-binding transcriptional regulator LsrR (DeoR family)